jgi:hypothetical protein
MAFCCDIVPFMGEQIDAGVTKRRASYVHFGVRSVRAEVEHPFRVIKLRFGFAKAAIHIELNFWSVFIRLTTLKRPSRPANFELTNSQAENELFRPSLRRQWPPVLTGTQ